MSTTALPTRIAKGGWYALALVALTQLLSLLDRNILAILGPRIKADLKVGDAEMGLLYGTVFALFYALFSLPLGRLADGWVRTKLLGISIAFWSLATALGGVAGGFALLAISRLGVGIGEAAAQPAGTSLVFDYFPKARRGLALAVLAAAIAVGLGLSSLLGGVAAGWWDAHYPSAGLKGWQFAFLVAALPGLPLAVLLWRLPEPKRGAIDGIPTAHDPAPFAASLGVLGSVLPGAHWFALAKRGAGPRDWAINGGALLAIVLGAVALVRWADHFSPRPPLVLGGLPIDPHALQWGVIGFGLMVVVNLVHSLKLADAPVLAVMKSPTLVMAMAVGSFQSMINYGAMSFTPGFLMKNFHLSPATVGVQFGLLAAGMGVVGPMIAGPVSDWVDRVLAGGGRVWLALFAMGVSPLLAIWVYHAPDAMSFYARFVGYSLVLTMWLPPLYAVMFDQVLPRMRGISASTYIIVSTITGLGIGPYWVGMVSDAHHGDLATAIISINWVAVPIVALLIVMALRVRKDEARVIERARAAGEGF